MRVGCTKCTADCRFPNQGRSLPPPGHAAKFGGAPAPQPTRCPTDAPVKFTPLAPAALPLEVAPQTQTRVQKGEGEGSSAEGLCGGADASLRWERGTPSPVGATAPTGVHPQQGVRTPTHVGSVRLDTPLFSGRVDEAKNSANPGASEICRQLQRGLVLCGRAVADGPQSPVPRRDWGRLLRTGDGIDRERRGASRSPGAEQGARGAQEAGHDRVLAVASQGKRCEGSFSQVAPSNGARHRLCSIKRGEATHHGAEPVIEEKVE